MHRPKPGSRRAFAFAGILAGAFALLGYAPPRKTTVLQRARIGGYAEGVAYVGNGPLAGYLAMRDGHEVWGVPAPYSAALPLRKLFDLRGLDMVGHAAAFTYVESRRAFALISQEVAGHTLWYVNARGRQTGSALLELPLPDGYMPFYFEGLTHIPASAGRYPDHLATLGQDGTTGEARVVVFDQQGRFAHQMVPACLDAAGQPLDPFFGDLQYLPGDRLLLVSWDAGSGSFLCTTDLDGISTAPATFVPSATGVGEGVTRLPDGRVVVLEWPQSLLFFDAALGRLPGLDRHDVIGLGLDTPRGIAWDHGRRRHLVSYREPLADPWPTAVASLPAGLSRATKVVDLVHYPGFDPNAPRYLNTNAGTTFLPVESRLVVPSRGLGVPTPPPGVPALPWFRGLLLYDPGTGALLEQIDLNGQGDPTLPPNARGRPRMAAWIPGASPGTGRFAVSFQGGTEQTKLYFFERDGTPSGGPVELSASLGAIIGLESFEMSHSRRLLIVGLVPGQSAGLRTVLVTDLAGTVLDSFDPWVELGVPGLDVSSITSGPYAGSFAMVDNQGELVVFCLN
jgi:hypothetical protein